MLLCLKLPGLCHNHYLMAKHRAALLDIEALGELSSVRLVVKVTSKCRPQIVTPNLEEDLKNACPPGLKYQEYFAWLGQPFLYILLKI